MTLYKLVTLVFLLYLSTNFTFCQNEIRFNQVEEPISRIQFWDHFSRIEPIILETNKKSVFHKIYKIESNDKRIIILSKDVLVYSRMGQFIRRIERGRGPKECSFPKDIFLSNRFIYILDAFSKVKVYNLAGKYEKCINLPFFCNKIAILEDKTLLVYSYLNEISPHYLFFIDLETEQILSEYLGAHPWGKKGFANISPFSSTNLGISVLHLFSDTIYTINDLSTIEKNPLLFDGHQLAKNYYNRLSRNTDPIRHNPKSKVSLPITFFRTRSLIFFRAHIDPLVSALFVYNSQNKHGSIGVPANFYFGDLSDRKVLGHIRGNTSEELIYSIQCTEFINNINSLTSKLNIDEQMSLFGTNSFLMDTYSKVTLNTNPIVFFVKPK